MPLSMASVADQKNFPDDIKNLRRVGVVTTRSYGKRSLQKNGLRVAMSLTAAEARTSGDVVAFGD